MQQPLWRPDAARQSSCQLSRFMQRAGSGARQPLSSYDELHAYSIEHPGAFWSDVWDYCEVLGDKGAPPYVVGEKSLPSGRFFPEARLNFAENALHAHGADPALVFWGEDKIKRRIARAELVAQVAQLQGWLEEAGVGAGDRVAAMLPNLPEAIAAVLAASSIGAVWCSCSPDFGVQGVLDRFGQITPKVLIVCDGYYYAGKTIDIGEKLEAVASQLTSVERIIVVSYLGRAEEVACRLGNRARTWEEAVLTRPAGAPRFRRLPFAHPLYILFSSGTTGRPKCIVHAAGGILLKHLSEHRLHCDIGAGDRLFYFTTLGWMMWNWLVSGLASGATLLLYDGSPFHPSGDILWDFAAAEGCTHFGTSAKYIDTLKKNGHEPRRTHDLSRLEAIFSTGSPLVAQSFDYVYESIKGDLHLASISGGTDICGCFVLGNPLKPVWRGEIQGPALGLAVDVVDEAGQHRARGKGELVCRNAFPSMPLGFWNDPQGKAYFNAYFARFPGMWHHGDFAEWTEHGGMIIHGRSDATLNPQGVRIGTAEIYAQVEQLPEIEESVAIGQDFEGDVRVVLFVRLKPGHVLDEELRARIKRQIREGASPRHVPAKILAVADIPRTKSGKITEIAVRDVVMGREVKNTEALANPEALELFRGLEELQS